MQYGLCTRREGRRVGGRWSRLGAWGCWPRVSLRQMVPPGAGEGLGSKGGPFHSGHPHTQPKGPPAGAPLMLATSVPKPGDSCTQVNSSAVPKLCVEAPLWHF